MATENSASLLAQLREIHLPEAPVAPSLAPVIVALILVAAALFVVLLKRAKKKPSWSDEALVELDNIADAKAPDSVLQTAALLKRIVLTHKTSVSHQTGDEWLYTLDLFFNTTYFSNGGGQIFGDRLYTGESAVPETLYRDLKKLIRRRKRQQ